MSPIRAIRMLNGLSQRELARRIGVSPTLLYRVERGYRKPEPELYPRLAKALGLPTARLEAMLQLAAAQAGLVVGEVAE